MKCADEMDNVARLLRLLADAVGRRDLAELLEEAAARVALVAEELALGAGQ